MAMSKVETELNGINSFLCETEKKVNAETEDLYQHKTSRTERIQAIQALIDENLVIALCCLSSNLKKLLNHIFVLQNNIHQQRFEKKEYYSTKSYLLTC